jgi:hypothetical protein
MKRSVMVFGMTAALVVAWSVGRVQGQKAEAKKVIFASADQSEYKAMGKAEGVTQSVLWVIRTRARMGRSRNSSPDTMPACTPTPMTFGLSA